MPPGANPNRHQQNRRPININPPLPKKACRKIARLQGTATIVNPELLAFIRS